MKIHEKLSVIQKELKAPKGQFNAFGKYKYRSCEDILEALKPHLKDGLTLIVNDEIVNVGDRFYIKATASLSDGNEGVSASAFAREPLSKKGMDESQITGATSSYARKYALNGLFCIDDTQDADSQKPTNGESNQPISETQLSRILDLAASKGADLNRFAKFMGVSAIEDIPVSRYQKAIASLEAKKAVA